MDTAKDEATLNEKIAAAKNSIKLGLDNETVSKIPGLPIEEIERLRNY